MTSLVERLRVEFDQWTFDPTFDARHEAADTIEALCEALAWIELAATNHAGWIEQNLETRWAMLTQIHQKASAGVKLAKAQS